MMLWVADVFEAETVTTQNCLLGLNHIPLVMLLTHNFLKKFLNTFKSSRLVKHHSLQSWRKTSLLLTWRISVLLSHILTDIPVMNLLYFFPLKAGCASLESHHAMFSLLLYFLLKQLREFSANESCTRWPLGEENLIFGNCTAHWIFIFTFQMHSRILVKMFYQTWLNLTKTVTNKVCISNTLGLI